MRRPLIPLVAVLAVVGATEVPASAAPPPRPTCGATITRSITLTADLVDCPGDGLIVAGDRITIDLGGHTLGGHQLGDEDREGTTGIRIDGRQDVKVVNGTIDGFDRGVVASNSKRLGLRALTVDGHLTGIRFTDVDHSSIRQTSVRTAIYERTYPYGTRSDAITLDDADHNRLTDVDVRGDGEYISDARRGRAPTQTSVRQAHRARAGVSPRLQQSSVRQAHRARKGVGPPRTEPGRAPRQRPTLQPAP